MRVHILPVGDDVQSRMGPVLHVCRVLPVCAHGLCFDTAAGSRPHTRHPTGRAGSFRQGINCGGFILHVLRLAARDGCVAAVRSPCPCHEMVELAEWKGALGEQGSSASKRARVDPSLDGEDDWFDTVDGDYVAAGEDADADDDDEEEDDQIVELAV